MASQAEQVLPLTTADGDDACPAPPAKWRRIRGKKEPGEAWASKMSRKELASRDNFLHRFVYKLPGAPSSAKSSYMLFLAKKLAGRAAGGEKLSYQQQLTNAAKDWKALSDEGKKEFAGGAEADKKRADEELKAFKHTPAYVSMKQSMERLMRMNSARQRVGEHEIPLKEWWKTFRLSQKPTPEPKAAAGEKKDAAEKPDRTAEKLQKKQERERDRLLLKALKSGGAGSGGPKAAKGAYQLFIAEVKGEEHAKGGGPIEMMKRMCERWKGMDAAAKDKYTKQAAEDKARYDKELAAFRESDDCKELKDLIAEFYKENLLLAETGAPPNNLHKWMRKKRVIMRNREKFLSGLLARAPKKKGSPYVLPRPPTAFMLFAKDKREEAAEDGGTMAEISKKVGEMWKEASAQEKVEFGEKAHALKVECAGAAKEFRKTEAFQSFVQAVEKWESEGKPGKFWVWQAKQAKKKLEEDKKAAKAKKKADAANAKVEKAAAVKAARLEKVAAAKAAKAVAKATARAAAAAAKAAAKAGRTVDAAAPDVTMLLKPMEEDPFWDGPGTTTTLDPDDLVLNDKLMVACARKGGEAASALLTHAAKTRTCCSSLFRRRSAGSPQTSLHYALLRNDIDMLRVLARERLRGSTPPALVPRNTGGLVQSSEPLVAKGTFLWTSQVNVKVHANPLPDAAVLRTLRHSEKVEVEDSNTQWIKLVGGGWAQAQNGSSPSFYLEDPDLRGQRLPAKNPELQNMSTGFSSGRAYRAKKLRKVKLSRGGREGNQAFVRDLDGNNYQRPNLQCDGAMQWAAEHGTTLETLQACFELFRGSVEEPWSLLGHAARFGHAALCRDLVAGMAVNDLWGLNNVHKLALKEDLTPEEITEAGKRKASVLKKAQDNFEITPLHLASIGPNKAVLESMLAQLGNSAEDQARDTEQRTLLHYAAASETSDALELLLAAHFSPNRTSNTGITPLMCACMANRPHNVALLLDAGADPMIRSDEKTAYHWAVQYGATEVVAVLLEKSAGKTVKGKGMQWEQAASSSKVNILHVACELGEERIVEMLLTSAPKALNKPDKQGRTPLAWAVMNGNTMLASKLLCRGATFQADTSGNTPLHYALAYGWRDAAKLLVDWGHAPDTQNTWRNTPVDAAVLKGHISMAAWFAKNYPIDPDTLDEHRRTLLTRSCAALSEAPWRAVLRAVVEARSANVNLPEGTGSLPICIAVQHCASMRTLDKEVEACLKLLCASKADVSAIATAGPMKDQSALSLALRGANHGLLCVMLRSGAGVGVHGRGTTLLHTISERVVNPTREGSGPDSAAVLGVIKEAVPEDILKQMARTPDNAGLFPAHTAVLRLNLIVNQLREQWKQYHQQLAQWNQRMAQMGGGGGGGFGFGGGFNFGFGGNPTKPNAPKEEAAVVKSFGDLVRWLRLEAGADLSAQVERLAEPRKEPKPNESISMGLAYGPVPSKLELIVESSVPAYSKDLWLHYDAAQGLATPLLFLIASGSTGAVNLYLDELETAGLLDSCLSAPNLYGVTPLVMAIQQAAGRMGLPAQTIRRLITGKAVATRLFTGQVPLHLATLGGNGGWGISVEAQTICSEGGSTTPAPAAPAPLTGGNGELAITGGSTGVGDRVAHYRSKMVEIWNKHNPTKVSEVDAILAKYKGREVSVYLRMCKKYGERPDMPRRQPLPQSQSPQAAPAVLGSEVPPDPRLEIFEAVLQESKTAGSADFADAGGITPLHVALQSGFRERSEFEVLGGEEEDFATGVLVREEARQALPVALRTTSGLHVLSDLQAGIPMGLPHCRVSFGNWSFQVEEMQMREGKIGLGDARALAGNKAGLHWIPGPMTGVWPAGGKFAIRVDVDKGEVWLAEGTAPPHPTPAVTGLKFEKFLFPVVEGPGSCHVRLGSARGFGGASFLEEVAPGLPSSERMVKALLAAQADVNAVTGDIHGCSALHLAATGRDPGAAHQLCDLAADANALTKFSGSTPLHIALRDSGPVTVAVANALILAGANVNLPSPFEGAEQPERYLYAQKQTFPRLPLHAAVEVCSAALVKLLVAAKADTNAEMESRSLKHHERWLPLPYSSEEPSDPGSQIDRGLQVGENVALKVQTAEELLQPLGVDPVKLKQAVEQAKAVADVVLGEDPAVLRCTIRSVMGEGTYELQGGEIGVLLSSRKGEPVSLTVPRKSLLVQKPVLSITKTLLRPIHRAAARNETGAVKALLSGGAEPSAVNGLDGRMALHCAAGHDNQQMVQALVDAKSSLDAEDATDMRLRPISSAVGSCLAGRQGVLKVLLQARAGIDLPCCKDGLTALHHAAAARHGPTIDLLLSHKADPAVRDLAKRTPLHKAVNAAAASEPSFVIERKLVDAGTPVNAVDKRNRTALHYAFVKEGSPSNSSFADPVETVTSMCAIEGVSIDVADEFGATPMLYAATRGATISSLYLAKRKGSLHSRDVYQNDLLGRALAASHHEYAITMLSQNAGDVNAPMRHVTVPDAEETSHGFRIFPGIVVYHGTKATLPVGQTATVDLLLVENYCAEWCFEVLSGGDVCLGLTAMPSSGAVGPSTASGWVCIHSRTGHLLVDGTDRKVVFDSMEPNDQVTFLLDMGRGTLSYSRNFDEYVPLIENEPELFAGRFWRPAVQCCEGDLAHVKLCSARVLPRAEDATGKPADPKGVQVSQPCTLFYEAIKNKWLGLAYLLLDHGFPFHRAIQDSLNLGEFRLVLTLLSKINPAENELVRGLDEVNRNLIHVLADFPGTLGPETPEIWQELEHRGVKPAHIDMQGRLPLHAAVAHGHFDLSRWLLPKSGEKACSLKTKAGMVPLHNACCRAWLSKHGEGRFKAFLGLLLPGNKKAASEPFPDHTFSPGPFDKDANQNPIKPPVGSLPLVNAIAAGFAEAAAVLVDAGAGTNERDSLGETPFGALRLHGASKTSVKIVQLLIFNDADPNLPDRFGDLPLRWAIRSPHCLELVDALVRAGAKITNKPGNTPPGSFMLDAMNATTSYSPTEKVPVPPIISWLIHRNALLDQGVDAPLGRSALMLAIDTGRLPVFSELLGAGAPPTCSDTKGRSALSIAITKRDTGSALALLKRGADPKVGVQEDGKLPLFAAVEWGDEAVVRSLLDNKADANHAGTDKLGCGPLSFAVRTNSMKLALPLLTAMADPRATDTQGRNAMHHCVQPLPYGSFENTDLLAALLKAPGGAEAAASKDKQGKTPRDLAQAQGSGKMALALGVQPIKPTSLSALSRAEEPAGPPADMEAMALARLEHLDANAEPVPTPVHKNYGMAGDNKVLVREEVEHDALLFKVDLKRNEMRFYHLQLVHEANKDLFVVFTRWGEIGETGMYQRTPMGTLEEALKEFGKIFKEKTGNAWETKDTAFERKPNKYQILKQRKAVARHDQLLKPFGADLDRCKLPSNLQRTTRALCDPAMVSEALSNLGFKTESMPFGNLTRATLNEAKELLGTIRLSIEEMKVLEHTHDRKDFADFAKKRNEIRERNLELSSRYYELIPRNAGVSEVAKPLEREDLLAKEFEALSDLAEASVGVQLLLAAQQNKPEEHELDYCFRGLGITLDEVDKSSEEFALLLKYAQETCTSGYRPQAAEASDFVKVYDFPEDDEEKKENGEKKDAAPQAQRKQRKQRNHPHDTITAIYRLARHGEAGLFEEHKADELQNRRLLWHGSRPSNMIGILTQGLRIAPPEAPVSGYMFGKGVYFADMFSKSRQYCRTSNANEPAYMILCDVALGHMYASKGAHYMEAPQAGSQSTWGMGRQHPDWANPIVEPGGTSLPNPTMQTNNRDDGLSLNYNEFIVYNTSQIRMRYLIELNNFEYHVQAPEDMVRAAKRAKTS